MPSRQKNPLSFDEVAKQAGVTTRVPLGVRPIRVKRIVGSAGKADKVGPDFLPLGPGPAGGNYRAILRRMRNGEDLPPITVYQLGNRYFVVDGHTRVAAARELGLEFLDADVIEALPPKKGDVNLTYYARKELERTTGLQGIRLTSPWRYELLQRHLEGYRLYLERSRGREVTLPEAAQIWYRTQYVPTVFEIRRRGLMSATGGRTGGDVYTDILREWQEDSGEAVSLREMLDKHDQRMKAEQTTLQRAKRKAIDVVDASLPKIVPSIGKTGRQRLVQEDVEAELAGLPPADVSHVPAVDAAGDTAGTEGTDDTGADSDNTADAPSGTPR